MMIALLTSFCETAWPPWHTIWALRVLTAAKRGA
jgi:hypothetical protein